MHIDLNYYHFFLLNVHYSFFSINSWLVVPPTCIERHHCSILQQVALHSRGKITGERVRAEKHEKHIVQA